MKSIEENLLEFLEDVENVEENFKNLKIKFEYMKIRDNKHDLRLFLHFISSISNNYYGNANFFQQNRANIASFQG